MNDYLNVTLRADALAAISSLGLAHVGDAVFELMVRTWLCEHGKSTSRGLHRAAVGYVQAPAQAKAVARVLPLLSDAEAAVFKRGRNAHVSAVPRRATHEGYHLATGMEALFGYLYLHGETARLNELFCMMMEEA